MSTSLLLALLEAHQDKESDLSRDYYAWIGAEWNGEKWVNGSLERRDLIMKELYDVLQTAIQSALYNSTSDGGKLGTVLARALTDEPRPVPLEAIRGLRALLKPELHKRFDQLIDRHHPLRPLGAEPA